MPAPSPRRFRPVLLMLAMGTSLFWAGCTAPSEPHATSSAVASPAAASSPAAPSTPAAASEQPPAQAPAAPAQAPAAPAQAPTGPSPGAFIKAHGVIEGLGADKRTFTVKHDPIPELSMEAMTMPYKVMAPSVLTGLSPKQEVDFFIDFSTGEYIVVKITPTHR